MGESLRLSIFCVFIVISVLWNPVLSEDKCNVGCKGSSSSPSYLSGHKYNYGVEGTISIFLTGADKQETSVKVLGQASVSSLGNCGYVLKVQNLALSGPDGKKYKPPNGLEKPVRFTLEDGRVGPVICSEEGDTRRSLNIKRAIISLLQTEQKPATQVDVFGACPTEASSTQEGGSLLVHRSRDLSRCAHHEHGKNDLITAIYNPSAEIKSTQVLQSSLHVESKVNNGVPEKIAATEEYLYKPFSVGESGARAKVLTKLTLTGKAGGADSGQFTESHTIIFERPHGVKLDQSNLQSALNAIKETSKTLTTEAGSKSAGLFAQLVRVLRTTDKDDLLKAYAKVKGNNLEKRVFLDGLLRAGTGPSVEASIQILKNKELSDLEQQLVFLSLGNARHVNDEALKAATTLLDLPNIPKQIYLGVGALAGAYCREHSCHAGKSEGIIALSQKLGAKLQNCKPKTKIEQDNVVAVLKGIRSIRHLEDSLIDKVVHCAADNGAKSRIRAAALEAFHADPCAAKVKKTALDIMKNRQLDSEIRIKAYLAVIECPCGKSATEIKNLLESEPVHQVGRFITTSLRAIRASANTDKKLARQHYGLIRTPNKFNVDSRKYSSYEEVSFNVDSLGIGGSVEQTIIFSQNSFIPRSASLNLTAEIFGHNLNVLEVGGRQGNLDRVVEHFLGPKSIFRTEKPQKLYDDIINRIKEAESKVEHGVRGRRSIKSEIDNFDKHVKAESAPYNNELDLDIYVKLFGTDAVFLSLGDDKGFDFNSVLDQALKYLDTGINKAKHFQQEVRTHLLFLDAEAAYPTSIGLPLKLNLVGSATGRLEASTNLDIRQILRNPENAKIDIKLIPSTDIEIAGIFSIDADAFQTGLKVITNLHTSTGGHIIAKILENGHGIDVQFGLPIDKQEILTASTDLVFVTAEKGQLAKTIPLKMDNKGKDYPGCFDQLSGVLGLTLCGEVSVPFSLSDPDAQAAITKFGASFPLSGPAKLKLVLEKNDLKGYHIKGVLHSDNPEKRSFELLFEAEGSSNRRTHVSGELINTQHEKSVKLSLESPIKTLSGEISLVDKPDQLGFLVSAKMDEAEYLARAGFSISGNERRSVLKPVIEYQLPDQKGKQSLKIDGQLIKESNGPSMKYSLSGVKVNIPNSNEIIDVDGYLKTEQNNMDLDLKAKKGEHNMELSSSLKGSEAKLLFQNTLNPNINFKVNGHFENRDKQYHNDIDLYYSGDLKSPQNRVTFNQLLKYHIETIENFNIITKNKLEIHALPIKVKIDAELDPKKVDIELEGIYIDKKAEFDLEARTNIKKPGDYVLKIVGDVNNEGIEISSKRDIVSPDKSNFENHVNIKNVAKYELSGVVLHKMQSNDVNVGAIGHLKIAGGGKNEDFKFDIGAIDSGNLYSSHAKISGSKGELLDYLLKINKGPNSNGQFKFVLKDSILANGDFKISDADGKGNAKFKVDFKKEKTNILGDVKFVAKDPVFNAEAELHLTNMDVIKLITDNTKTDKLVESKTKLLYGDKKTELNVHVEGTMDYEGKTKANIELVLPDERCLTYKLDRNLDTKGDVTSGDIEMILSDAEKSSGPASTISYNAKLAKLDKDSIDYAGELDIKLKNGKGLKNTFTLKNVPQGDKEKLDFKTEINGDLIPKPVSLSTYMEYTDESLVDGYSNYKVKGSYGSDIAFEAFGKEEIKVLEKGDKKLESETTVTLKLPFEKAHDLKLHSYLLYLDPNDDQILAEYSVIDSVQVNSDVYKVDASGKIGQKSGFSKVKLLVPQVDPLSLDVNYKADLEGEKKTANVELKSLYGKGKSAVISADAVKELKSYNLKIKANAPQAEKLKKLEFELHTKNPSPDTYSGSIIVDADGRVYKSESLVVYSKAHPFLDLKYSSPSTQAPSRVYIKGSSLSSTQGKLEVKIENINKISFDAVSEGTIQKDNIVLKLNANSPSLNLKNYDIQIVSKDTGNGKRLEFHATNDNKNILSGSTSLISKQEGPKTIIEGSGSVKVKDEQKPANFKYIRTMLTDGNEQGVETFLNLAIGERSYVAESRVTNLEYKNSYVYCEEKKQCAHAELHSKIVLSKPGEFQHTVNAGLDLRKLGFAPEFGLQINNEVSETKLPQYSLDLHVSKEAKKYHLHVYSQPESGKFPAGVTISLPQRVLALESLVTYPTNKNLPFPIKGELSLNMDKNKPNMKAGARFLVDVTGADKQHSAVAEIGFSHPKLGKEALVRVRGKLQIPEQNSFKIETSTFLSHPSLGENREAKLLLQASPNNIKFLVDTPIVKVIDLEGSAVLKETLQQADLKFSLLEGKPVVVHAIAKDFQYYEFTTGYSDESERKLSIIGHLELEKRVSLSADIILPGEKKTIAHGSLFLKDNLVNSDYGFSKDNLNYFVNAFKKDVNTLEGRIKQLSKKANNEVKSTLQRVEPTYNQIELSYRQELENLYKEVSDDKVIQEISQMLNEVIQIAAKMITEVVELTKPIVDKIKETITVTASKIQELYEKQIEPGLEELYKNIAAVLKESLDGLLDAVAHFAALAQDFIDKHKPELQELTNTLAEIFKDLTRLVVAQLKELSQRLSVIFKDLKEQIGELPLIALIKEKYQELAVPEQLLGMLHEAHMMIRELLPTEEISNLADAIYSYVEKKLRQEKVDDSKELRVIYEKFTIALTSSIQFVRSKLNQYGMPSLLTTLPALSGPSQSLPSFSGGASFSLLSQLLRGDLPDPLAILRAYRPRSINPLDEIPAKLRAVVVNGQHIFTFDGRHLTFPGTCRYVLVHDHVDRNFSLVLQLNNGAPKSLVLEDKSGNVIELKDNGQVALNGAAHGFPVEEKDSFAFRQPNGRIGLGTLYGLMAFCTGKLEVCYIEVSGFYLGKLRGLLGDGNNEPFDDFRLPNGKIVTSEADFGNAYKLASSCPPVKTPDHSHHPHHQALPPACEQVFGSSSPLRPLALLLDVSPFRQACTHAVTSNPSDALKEACDIARGYAALAVTGLLPAVLPPACVRCTDADKPKEVGDTYELRLPSKQADIVVNFETTKDNEKNYKALVVPLVSQVVDSLKAKRIDDIKVYLVGITSKFPYPIVYDTDLKLKNPKVRFEDESRYNKIPVVETGYPVIDKYEQAIADAIEAIRISLGLTNVIAGYNSVLDLPLRPGAVKHAINVVGEKCHSQLFLLEAIRSVVYSEAFEQNAYTHSLVTITPDVKLTGKNINQVVGFTKEEVLSVGDKKRTKESEALRSSLERSPDACIDFVESTGGFVFSATNYHGLNPGQQKQYLQTASGAIVGSMLREQIVQECTCGFVDPFRVRSICVNKERKEAARRRK